MKRLLVDLSSVVWTNLLGGKDTEFGKLYLVDSDNVSEIPKSTPKRDDEVGKRVFVNSADYGYEKSVEHLVRSMEQVGIPPRNMIFVMEGKNSKFDRQAIHPGYKASDARLPQQYEQFNLCKQQVLDAFLAVGAQMCWQDGGVEGDDVLGYLALNLDGERVIDSGDKDLAVLVGADPNIHHLRQGQMDKNPFGPFPHHLIATYIALVGDNTDKIPGARDFGVKTAEKLLIVFGDEGLAAMEGLIKDRRLRDLQEDVADLQKEIDAADKGTASELKDLQRGLQKIIDDAEGVYMSYELARLRIERVNTLHRPLHWKAGMVKPRALCQDERLRKYAGMNKLVSAENYDEAMAFLRKHLPTSPSVALDIETSTPPESDEWVEAQGKEDGKVVDVLGSELTGMSVTFGVNMQYTLYLTHEHVPEEGITNLTLGQVRDFVDQIPRHLICHVHNSGFELSVLYQEWGKDWAHDDVFHGFLRNVRDTVIMSSYADENRSRHLKSLSATVLDYQQTNYDEVTTKVYKKAEWNGAGKVLGEWTEQIERRTGRFEVVVNTAYDEQGNELSWTLQQEIIEMVDGDAMVKVQHKMNELRAREVMDYGCDDTICTAALAQHFRTIMEIEGTYDTFEEVETWPQYVLAKAFVDGIDFSLESMREQEKEDDKTYDAAWLVLREYLMKIGFEGTRCPVYTEMTPANIKEAFQIITGNELKTLVRTPSKLAKLIEQEAPDQGALAAAVSQGDLAAFNATVADHFTGEPKLDLASPKQMKALLYDHIGIPIQIINDVTPLERQKNPDLAEAVMKFKRKRAGKDVGDMRPEEMALLKAKAKTDDTAIDYALAFDLEYIDDDARRGMEAVGAMKKVMTRRSLFYKNYWHARHWKTGRIHPNINQVGAVTRRPTGSRPNVYQLPKKGEGAKFRRNVLPHRRDAVVCSIDFVGQELRLAAERSQDKNMLACYVGDNLKDIHSITAAGAMKLKWGAEAVAQYFAEYGNGLEDTESGRYDLFLKLRAIGKAEPVGKLADDLRKDSKNVNFAAQFGGKAAKLSETLIMRLEDAQVFLDARSAMFPDVDRAAERAADFAKRHGYAVTMMGGRRHLREAMVSDERGAADRASRQAWNFEIQGSAAEMAKLALARLWKSGALHKYDVRLYAWIYDEIVTSVRADHALEFIKIKHDCMTQPYSTMQVPILGSVSVGPNFADQHECGDWFIEENVRKALNDIVPVKEAA